MLEEYIYDKKIINVNPQVSILEECKSTNEIFESNIYFNFKDDIVYIGSCKTNNVLGIFEWMEYDDEYLVLFSKSMKDNNIKITKLFDICTKEFVDGDQQSLYNACFRRKKSKIKSKK